MKSIVGLFGAVLIAIVFCLNPQAFSDAPPPCSGQKPQDNTTACVDPGWSGCKNFYTNDPCPTSVPSQNNCAWQDITVGQGYWGCVDGDIHKDICLDQPTTSMCFQNNCCFMRSNGNCLPGAGYIANIVMVPQKRNPTCTDPDQGA